VIRCLISVVNALISRGGNKRAVGTIYLRDEVRVEPAQEICGSHHCISNAAATAIDRRTA